MYMKEFSTLIKYIPSEYKGIFVKVNGKMVLYHWEAV